MTTQLAIHIPGVRIIPAYLAAARRLPLLPLTGLEGTGEVAVDAALLRGPRPCAAGVTLGPVAPLPDGGVDAVRRALGRDGSWPAPRPGWLQDAEDEEE